MAKAGFDSLHIVLPASEAHVLVTGGEVRLTLLKRRTVKALRKALDKAEASR